LKALTATVGSMVDGRAEELQQNCQIIVMHDLSKRTHHLARELALNSFYVFGTKLKMQQNWFSETTLPHLPSILVESYTNTYGWGNSLHVSLYTTLLFLLKIEYSVRNSNYNGISV